MRYECAYEVSFLLVHIFSLLFDEFLIQSSTSLSLSLSEDRLHTLFGVRNWCKFIGSTTVTLSSRTITIKIIIIGKLVLVFSSRRLHFIHHSACAACFHLSRMSSHTTEHVFCWCCCIQLLLHWLSFGADVLCVKQMMCVCFLRCVSFLFGVVLFWCGYSGQKPLQQNITQ